MFMFTGTLGKFLPLKCHNILHVPPSNDTADAPGASVVQNITS